MARLPTPVSGDRLRSARVQRRAHPIDLPSRGHGDGRRPAGAPPPLPCHREAHAGGPNGAERDARRPCRARCPWGRAAHARCPRRSRATSQRLSGGDNAYAARCGPRARARVVVCAALHPVVHLSGSLAGRRSGGSNRHGVAAAGVRPREREPARPPIARRHFFNLVAASFDRVFHILRIFIPSRLSRARVGQPPAGGSTPGTGGHGCAPPRIAHGRRGFLRAGNGVGEGK